MAQKEIMIKLENLNGIKSIEISNHRNDYWQIKFDVFQNDLNSFRSIDKIRKIVRTNDDLIFYRNPSPFSFTKNDRFQVVIINTNKSIRPEEVIEKIRNTEEKDEIEEDHSSDFNTIGQFLFSWDEIEKFYRFILIDKYHEWKNPSLKFIRDLRKLGYDKIFRAGQQLSTFILSRCLNHGMTAKTNHLRINFLADNQMEVVFMSKGIVIQKDTTSISISNELIDILERMKNENEIK